MQAKWYYGENGGVLGPATVEEIAGRIGQAPGQKHLVWAEGMAEWTDASKVPEFFSAYAAAADQNRGGPEHKARLPARLRKELIDYAIVSAYLYVCFGALILYKASILHSEGLAFAPFGIAVVKALITGKFVLLLKALKLGENGKPAGSVLTATLVKSLLFTLLLIVLTVIEEMIVGYFHDKAAREVLSEIAGGTLLQAFAVGLILFLILIPYFGFQEISARLGEGELKRLLLKRRSPGKRT